MQHDDKQATVFSGCILCQFTEDLLQMRMPSVISTAESTNAQNANG